MSHLVICQSPRLLHCCSFLCGPFLTIPSPRKRSTRPGFICHTRWLNPPRSFISSASGDRVHFGNLYSSCSRPIAMPSLRLLAMLNFKQKRCFSHHPFKTTTPKQKDTKLRQRSPARPSIPPRSFQPFSAFFAWSPSTSPLYYQSCRSSCLQAQKTHEFHRQWQW